MQAKDKGLAGEQARLREGSWCLELPVGLDDGPAVPALQFNLTLTTLKPRQIPKYWPAGMSLSLLLEDNLFPPPSPGPITGQVTTLPCLVNNWSGHSITWPGCAQAAKGRKFYGMKEL